MKSTTCTAPVLTVVAGLLVSCATVPSTRGEKEALVAEAASTMKQMTAEDPTPGTLVQTEQGN
jgi:hypothetical protein